MSPGNKRDSSSDEETKVIESGADKHRDSVSSTSSECAMVGQRGSSDDAVLVCIQCEKVYLCSSGDDLIHSIGVYKKHTRMEIEQFLKAEQDTPVVQQEIVASVKVEPKSQEEKEVVQKLEAKVEFFKTKIYEGDIVLNNYGSYEKELSLNYESSTFSVQKNMKYLKELIQSKENELLAELRAIKDSKTSELSSGKEKILELKTKIKDIGQILAEGINKPAFTLTTGSKFIDK